MSKSSFRAPAYTFSRAQKLVAVAALAAVAVFFRDSFTWLWSSWQRSEYSHCVLIPFLSAFLLWQRWPEFRRRQFQIMPAGVLLLFAGFLLWLPGSRTGSAAVEAHALIVVVAGVLLTLMGWNAFKRALGPLALLILMIPLPESLHDIVASRLHEWSLGLGVGIMRLLDISVLLEGTLIDFGTSQLNLTDSSSGLSILLPLLSLAIIMAYFAGGRLWVRAAIVLSTFPIAILMDGVRVGALGMQVLQTGTTLRLLHLFEGWVIFMICVLLLVAELWLLLILSGDRRRLREALAIDWTQSNQADTGIHATVSRGRILLIAGNFAPEMTGIGKYMGEMSAWLAAAGFEIRVITAPPYYPAWRVAIGYSSRRYSVERLAGALVYRCPLLVPRRPGGITRLLQMMSFVLSTLPVILWQALAWRPQVVFVVQPPLGCAPGALLGARLCGAQSWLHVQDFEVDAAFDLGLLRNETLRRAAFAAEHWLMLRFDRVSSISAAMLKKLADKGVAADRIHFFPNWVDTQMVRPLAEANPLRAELGIDPSSTVLLYSGNMGEKQGLGLLIDVARGFSGSEHILFLLCGDGAAKRRTMDAAQGLANVRFLPLQPLERLNELLNLADVHLLPQRAEAEDLVMPSKLTAIMASGRPVVASARPGSDVARAAITGGLVVPPGDVEAFSRAIRKLIAEPALRADLGAAGRAHAVANWHRDAVMRSMLAGVDASLARPGGVRTAQASTAVPTAAQD